MHNKVIVLVPPLSSRGGISTYYRSLRPYLPDQVEYCFRGARGNEQNKLMRAVLDYLAFIRSFISHKPSVVHVNTSIGVVSVLRDSVYIALALLFKKKVIVFFRGWSTDACKKVEMNVFLLFKITFMRADLIVTLSEKSRQQIIKWGYSKRVLIETTAVDERILRSPLKFVNTNNDTFTILFLARIEKDKGIFELIEACRVIHASIKSIRLVIAGSGSASDQVIKSAEVFDWIHVAGYVDWDEKAIFYLQSDVYVLPSYREGMPNSVLEAMAFGLPIVCTGVGALSEIIQNGVNGLIVDTMDVESLKKGLLTVINNKVMRKAMSINNKVAAKKYYASYVAERLLSIYDSINE